MFDPTSEPQSSQIGSENIDFSLDCVTQHYYLPEITFYYRKFQAKER